MGIESTTSDDLAAWIMVDGLTAIPFLASGDRVYAVSPGDRLAVYIHPDGTVAYYINYMGALSDPWFVSPVKLDLSNQYRLIFTTQPTGTISAPITVSIRNIRWLRNIPEFNYTGEMQKADNVPSHTLPTTVHVGVRKLSSHPLGPPSDWLYASFVRP